MRRQLWEISLLRGELRALRCSGPGRELKCIPDPLPGSLSPGRFWRSGAVGSCGQESSGRRLMVAEGPAAASNVDLKAGDLGSY